MFQYLVAKKNNLTDIENTYIGDVTYNFIKEITLADLYEFLSYIDEVKNSSSYSKARFVAAIKAFFKFTHSKLKIIDENISLELESPKIEKRLPVYLTLEQSKHVLKSMDRGNYFYERDYCIITLFLNCGMRLSELCNIQITDIIEDRLTIIGKGNKQRVVYLNSNCLKAIDDYLKVRGTAKAPEDDKYLFLSKRKTHIGARTIEVLVKKHIENAGFKDKKYTPHKLRHSAATIMFKHGKADIRSVQSILGHESISTTELYTHVDDDMLRNIAHTNPLLDD